jgi:hypothetical protein
MQRTPAIWMPRFVAHSMWRYICLVLRDFGAPMIEENIRSSDGRIIMVFRSSTSAIVVAVTATVMMAGAGQAAGDAKYPDWKGAWTRWFPLGSAREPNGGFTAGGQPSHDQTKPWGPGQEAPLTPEYQKVYEESRADQANGGEGNFFDHSARCMPGGMPLITAPKCRITAFIKEGWARATDGTFII